MLTPGHPSHGSRSRAAKMNKVYDQSSVKNARRVSMLTVRCPDCGADLGEPCLNKQGSPMTSVHAVRKRLATRLDNQRREDEGTLSPDLFPVRKRGSMETDDEGVEVCSYCGLRIKLNKHGRRVKHTPHGNQRFNIQDIHCPGSDEQVV